MTAVLALKDRTSDRLVEELANRLRRRQVEGSQRAAVETFHVLRQVVARSKFNEIKDLLEVVKNAGRRLVAAQPKECTVGNIVRKILHLIREEGYASGKLPAPKTTTTSLSLADFIRLAPLRAQTHGTNATTTRHSNGIAAAHSDGDEDEDDADDEGGGGSDFKGLLMDSLREILDELETVYENVAKNARDHVHADELVLTLGRSRTVAAFLGAAAHTRRFSALVAEGAPRCAGREGAADLMRAGVAAATVVPDSAVWALMPRVNKVLLGAHAILADGGMLAPAGALLAAAAARAHAVPVVVCAGQFKLTPRWGAAAGRDFGDPAAVLGFDEGELVEKVDVLNPQWDYVPPGLIDVYITNYGDHAPSIIHRLIKDSYDDEDTDL